MKKPKLTVSEQIKIVEEIHKAIPPVYKGKTILKGKIKPAK